MVDNNIVVAQGDVTEHEAMVNLTWNGQNYDLRNPVLYEIPEADLKGMLSEVIRAGGDGIPADGDVGPMADYVVQRHGPTATRPFRLITVRPKTEFG